MKKTKTKCYLYTRVSTSMQVDGYSLDAQRDKLRKYAEYEDMVVAGEYSDEHVIIGTSGENLVKSRGSALVPFSFLLRDKPKSFKSLKIINERL